MLEIETHSTSGGLVLEEADHTVSNECPPVLSKYLKNLPLSRVSSPGKATIL
jgi:hypothetical protein